ncbi:MAG: hypothetical protein AAB316_03310, partial [Bacteroidota bacterium]
FSIGGDAWDGFTQEGENHSDVFFRVIESWSQAEKKVVQKRSASMKTPTATSHNSPLEAAEQKAALEAKFQKLVKFIEGICGKAKSAWTFCTVLLGSPFEQLGLRLKELLREAHHFISEINRGIREYLIRLIHKIANGDPFCPPNHKLPENFHCNFYLLSLAAALAPLYPLKVNP